MPLLKKRLEGRDEPERSQADPYDMLGWNSGEKGVDCFPIFFFASVIQDKRVKMKSQRVSPISTPGSSIESFGKGGGIMLLVLDYTGCIQRPGDDCFSVVNQV